MSKIFKVNTIWFPHNSRSLADPSVIARGQPNTAEEGADDAVNFIYEESFIKNQVF
jgi:hypothetical protein